MTARGARLIAVALLCCACGSEGVDLHDGGPSTRADSGSPLDSGGGDASEADANLGDAMDAGLAEDATFRPDAADLDDGSIEPDSGEKKQPEPRARVAFSSRRAGDFDLFYMDLDGTGIVRLTADVGDELYTSWSPDGRRIAFASTRSGRSGIYVLDLETGNQTPISVSLPLATGPAFSPDGSRIAFHGRRAKGIAFDIFVVTSTGGTPVALTDHGANDTGPAWSPDGTTIYFVSNRASGFEVYAMNADGTNQRAIGTGTGVIGKPAPSPDGRYLAYAIDDGTQTIIVRRDLMSGAVVPLTDRQDAEPAYSPDGRYLTFSSQRFRDPEIMLLDLSSTAPPVRLTAQPGIDGTPSIGPVIP